MRTVRDIMRREVVTVAPDASIRELVQVLMAKGISGAPVVDERGGVLGVVSTTDVIRFAAQEAEIPVGAPEGMEARLPAEEQEGDADDAFLAYFLQHDRDLEWRPVALAGLNALPLDTVHVREIMTPAQFRVRPDATIREAARFLAKARIHRALVVEAGRLTGIVSSLDILEAFAEAGPE